MRKKITFLILMICIFMFSVPVCAKTYKYTVKYNSTGGRKTPAKQTKKSKKKKVSIRLTKKKPSKKGYTFQKWNTKRNGKGKSYKPGSKITLKKTKRNITLYAIWKKKAVEKKSTKQAESKKTEEESSTEQQKEEPKTDEPAPLPPMEVHFIDVGQGDCTLIGCNGEWMLIDAGDNTKGTAVQSYLMSKGVKTLKYVVGTHPDADHIGGLDVIITKFDVQNLFMPDFKKDTKTYDDVVQAAKYKSLKIQQPEYLHEYKLGDACFYVISLDKDYASANNSSICIRLLHWSKSFLFVGDAEEEAEMDMYDVHNLFKVDVYKAAHHGSRTGSIEQFMNAIKPKYAVISCGEGNSYGHPHAEVLNRFRKMKIKVFRTDEQGTIVAKSDGKTIKWNMSPSTSWKAGENTQSSTETLSEQQKYILNRMTGIFHKPDCQSVSVMGERNKINISGTKEELIEKGYKACGNCFN